eukprot:4477596-Lingulodinium_polyedra.AAC.1
MSVEALERVMRENEDWSRVREDLVMCVESCELGKRMFNFALASVFGTNASTQLNDIFTKLKDME